MSEISKKGKLLDITCNMCGGSCKENEFVIDNDSREDHGETYRTFNSIKIEKYFGYESNRDEQYWSADICDKCFDKYLIKLMKFDKFKYNIITGEVNKKPLEK